MIWLTIWSIVTVLLLVAVLWTGLIRIHHLLQQIGGEAVSTPTSLLARIRWGVRAIERQTQAIEPQARRLCTVLAALGDAVAQLAENSSRGRGGAAR